MKALILLMAVVLVGGCASAPKDADAQYREGFSKLYPVRSKSAFGVASGVSNALRGGSKPKEAFHWFSKAASQGHLKSKVQLGDMYHAGIGVEKDLAKAMKWRLEAAEEGHGGSQYTVGQMYLTGQGVMKSRISGFAWIIVAGTNDYTPAAAYRRLMDIQGDPKEIAMAETLAKEMLKKNPKLLK